MLADTAVCPLKPVRAEEVTLGLDDVGDAAARLYLNLGPLFDEAYAELGHSKGEFHQTLLRALGQLLATPVSPRRFDLVRQRVSFAFADPQLEALAPAQKMMIRMGPDNRAKVQAKLEEFRAALEAAKRAP